ncbi:DUF2946 family protein [Leptothrix cholodnii]|uniref:DUF2946 family protein n=1 Tax=Leptothrix cholodnii TaxID=34029 RepID=UPI000A06DF7A|nr:DUF2946 family protein [Leptothrix cholodnii]
MDVLPEWPMTGQMANSPTIAAMQGLRAQHRWISWMGVMLVLMSLLAPTVSHAVRDARGVASAASILSAWCSPSTLSQDQGAQSASAADSTDRHDALAGEPACGYCLSAALNTGVAAAQTRAVKPPLQPVARTHRSEARPLGTELPTRHRSRAPPLSS